MTVTDDLIGIGVAVGPEALTALVKSVVDIAGGPDKVRAILDAEYAATDIAIRVLENERLKEETKP